MGLLGLEHYGFSAPDEGSVRQTVFVKFVVRFPPNCTLPVKVNNKYIKKLTICLKCIHNIY